MKTFSQAPTQANQLNDIVDVLSQIPDNTTKIVSPKDIRDAVYTLWENSMFKPTTFSGSTVDYIGIDAYQLKDDSDQNWYPKIYFGKKQTGGQFILDNNLINQNKADFFFYNTKNNQTLNDYDTTIAILSGTHSHWGDGILKAPQIGSVRVQSPYGNYSDMNIQNTSYVWDGLTASGGNINVRSEKGFVTINGFYFPTFKELDDNKSSYQGYVLSLELDGANNPRGVWRSPFSQSITNINTSENFTITSPLITLNGYNFSDSLPVAADIGGIRAGETFSNVDVLDMIRRIIYTYVPPRISQIISLISQPEKEFKLLESGDKSTYDNVRIVYNITKNATYSLTQYQQLPAGNLTDISPVNKFPSAILIQNGLTVASKKLLLNIDLETGELYKNYTFTFSVTDQYPTTKETSGSFRIVLPYFFGVGTYSATQSEINSILGTNSNPGFGKLKPFLTEPIIGNPTNSNNQYLKFTTEGLPNNKGYIYFGYPIGFPQLSSIYDDNGYNITSAFATYSISNISSPHTPIRWSGKNYIFYISNETTVPITSGTFSFLFV